MVIYKLHWAQRPRPGNFSHKTPEKAKEIASRVPKHMQKHWHSIKIGIMEKILLEKNFKNCDDFKNSLINSGDKRIVEAVKSDRQWSCGLNPKGATTTKPKFYPDENRLGMLLEQIRSTLIGENNTPLLNDDDNNNNNIYLKSNIQCI